MTREIDLSGEWLGISSPAHVRSAAKAALDAGETHYTTRPGIVPLRRAIAASFQTHTGVIADPMDQVLITCGESEGIFVALHTLVSGGDEVVIVGPSPKSDAEVVREAGGLVRHVPWPDLESDPEAMVRGWITSSTKAILVHTPSLTGQLLPPGAAQALVRAAKVVGATILSVETLADFTRPAGSHPGFALHVGAGDQTVTIGGFAAWGLDGWRVGYLLGPEPLVTPMTAFKQALSICSPALGQYAALAALTGPDEHLRRTQASLDSRGANLVTEFARGGVEVAKPVSGYHVFVPAPGGDSDIARRVRESVDVRVSAGADVGVPGTMRLTLSEPESTLVEAARRISPLLNPGAGGLSRG